MGNIIRRGKMMKTSVVALMLLALVVVGSNLAAQENARQAASPVTPGHLYRLSDAAGSEVRSGEPADGGGIASSGSQNTTVRGPCPTVVGNVSDSGTDSLRWVVANACDGTTITFDSSVTGIIHLTSGAIPIAKNLTIQGPGAKRLAVDGNAADRIFHHTSGTVAISGLTIQNGWASINGGGIYSTAALSLTDCVISGCLVTGGNNAAGGGIYAGGGLTMDRCTVSGNRITDLGAGGGLEVYGNPCSITNSTFSDNTVPGAGAGLDIWLTDGTLLNCTITLNTTGSIYSPGGIEIGYGTLHLKNTIVAGNGPDTSQIYTFSAGFDDQGNNLTSGDPLVAPLGDYGGPTPTHALICGSPALDAGNNTGAPSTDQRLVARPQYTTVDIGAFENLIVLSPAGLPGGPAGVAYSQTFTASGGTSPYTFSSIGTFPSWLSLSADGKLTGTPTATGNWTILVKAEDTQGFAGVCRYTISITCPTITVSPSSLVGGTTGVTYTSVPFSQTGGVGAVTWSKTGTLPNGMAFSAGVLSGMPTQAGSFPFTVTATDINGCTGSQNLTLTVVCPTIAVSPSILPNGTVGVTYTSVPFSQTGGAGAVTWSNTGTLPNGMTFNAGILSGMPTQTGSFPFTVTATDIYGCTGSRNLTLTVVCPSISVMPSSLPTGETNIPYPPVPFSQTGGMGTITWSESGALPAGMGFDAGTATLSGTPTASGSFPILVKAMDVYGCANTGGNYTLVILACQAPSGLTNNAAADLDSCADTGVRVTWAQDPADWGDNAMGTRRYNVLRGGTPIAVGLPYGTTTVTDIGGDNGTPYLYVVQYVNGCGTAFGTAGVEAADIYNLPPGAFNPVRPSNGAQNQATANLLLDWSDSAQAASYTLYFGTGNPPPVFQTGLTASQFTVSKLTEETQYYWSVTATGSCPPDQSTEVWSFKTGTPCTAPSAPGLVSPSNGATAVAVPLTLAWSAAENATSYEIWLGTQAGNLTLVGTTPGLSFTVGGLADGTTYFWLISAVDACGVAHSPQWSFTTAGQTPPTQTTLFIPAAASSTGARSSNWKTDMQVMNTGDAAMDFTLTFIPADTDGTQSAYHIPGHLDAGQVSAYADIVHAAFGLTQVSGALRAEGAGRMVAITRTYNDTGNGTYGQLVKGYGTDSALGPLDTRSLLRSGDVGYLINMISGTAFRTNVGFMEVTGAAATVEVKLFDDLNAPLGTKTYPVPPMGFHQVADIFSDLGVIGEHPAGRAEVRVSGEGSVLAYASVIDNTTGDAIFTAAEKLLEVSTEGQRTLAVAARSAGAKGTAWRTDVRALNPTAADLGVTYTYRPDAGEVMTGMLTVPPQGIWYATDALGRLFDVTEDTTGSLQMAAGSSLLVTSRIYTAGEGGTYGQDMASLRSDEGIVAGGKGILLGLRTDDGYRTNLGLTEFSGSPMLVRVSLYDMTGALLTQQNAALAAFQHVQWNEVFGYCGLPGDRQGYALVEAVSGDGRVAAYASVVDNITGDAIYIPAQ